MMIQRVHSWVRSCVLFTSLRVRCCCLYRWCCSRYSHSFKEAACFNAWLPLLIAHSDIFLSILHISLFHLPLFGTQHHALSPLALNPSPASPHTYTRTLRTGVGKGVGVDLHSLDDNIVDGAILLPHGRLLHRVQHIHAINDPCKDRILVI